MPLIVEIVSCVRKQKTINCGLCLKAHPWHSPNEFGWYLYRTMTKAALGGLTAIAGTIAESFVGVAYLRGCLSYTSKKSPHVDISTACLHAGLHDLIPTGYCPSSGCTLAKEVMGKCYNFPISSMSRSVSSAISSLVFPFAFILRAISIERTSRPC